MKNIYFISGLPRSGSTLLSALLNQNPALAAGMSSPVFSLVNAMMGRLSSANEFNAFLDDEKRRRILRGLFENYYDDQPDKVVFDTNRNWTPKIEMLLELFPNTKFICCVRPIAEIIQSFERLFAANSMQLSKVVNYDPDTTVYTRADMLMIGNGLVGLPLNGLKEAFYGRHSEHLMLVSYKNLATRPAIVLKAIYDFVGESAFDHRFDNLAFDVREYDAQIGLPGLHDLRAKVSYSPANLSIPPDLVARFAGTYFWEAQGEPTEANCLMAR